MLIVRIAKHYHAKLPQVIREKRAKFEEKLRNAVDSNNNSTTADENGNVVFADEEDDMLSYKKPQIFVDQLLTIPNDGKPFTHEEITDHIYTMIAAVRQSVFPFVLTLCLMVVFGYFSFVFVDFAGQ